MKQLISIIKTCLSLFAITLLSAAAHASDIVNIEMQDLPEKSSLQLSIHYSDLVQTPNVFFLEQGTPRIVVDVIADTDALPADEMAGKAAVKRVRYAQRDEGSRLVFDLAPEALLGKYQHEGIKTTIEVLAPHFYDNFVSGSTAQLSTQGVPIPHLKPTSSATARAKPIIVIDPGHGGYDPGAIGVNGTREKHVTMSAAQSLKAQLLATGLYEVILTRVKDVYVDHDERVRMARLKDADLFISIHADSMERRAIRGASVYTLADYARKRSTRLVDSQNWILDVDLSKQNDDVGHILVDLAQRKTFSNSDKFAQMLVPELAQVSPLLGNTHRRAGLAVLLAPDVPAVLLEMGFISNEQDEKNLNSQAHRDKLMKAVAEAIKDYFEE